MASLDDVISKIPRPAFVAGVFILALIVIVYTNPLKDGCDVQVSNFSENVKGFLINSKMNKKLKIAEVSLSKDFCKEGNSQGSCENYFAALAKIGDAFTRFDHQCLPQLSEDENFTNLQNQLKDALKILALLAWGEKPPEGVSDRMGWLAKTEIYTFCRLKTILIELMGPEDFKKFRMSVYQEYPLALPDKPATISSEDMARPKALKSLSNPGGTLTEEEVFQRSLFSLRCDQYQ